MNSEQADLKARFGAPPDRDLPPGRQAQHREYLMSCISGQSSSGAVGTSSRFPHRPARRRLPAAVAGGAVCTTGCVCSDAGVCAAGGVCADALAPTHKNNENRAK